MANILIIEDDHGIRFSLRITLETLGHAVDVAEDGVQGCAMCANADYDLVITDIIMPNRNGVETIAILKSAKPTLKVVAMTGGGSQGETGRLEGDIDADYMLGKPFSIGELKTCLDDML